MLLIATVRRNKSKCDIIENFEFFEQPVNVNQSWWFFAQFLIIMKGNDLLTMQAEFKKKQFWTTLAAVPRPQAELARQEAAVKTSKPEGNASDPALGH